MIFIMLLFNLLLGVSDYQTRSPPQKVLCACVCMCVHVCTVCAYTHIVEDSIHRGHRNSVCYVLLDVHMYTLQYM